MLNEEKKTEVTYTIDNNDNNNNNNNTKTWRSMCFTIDKTMTVYLIQFVITLFILSFSAYMLSRTEYNCEKSSPYINLIMFILGKVLASVMTTH